MKRIFGVTLSGCMLLALPSLAAITGGNPVVARSFVDAATSNFSLVDTNNPINGPGQITQWQVFAANTNAVELLIFHPTSSTTFTLLGNSAQVTPAVGLNTFNLTTPITVQAGDEVGLYFPGTGSVNFDLSGPLTRGDLLGKTLLTASGAGIGPFTDSSQRTYSLLVTGNNLPGTPVPPSVLLMLVGLATLGFFIASGKFARA